MYNSDLQILRINRVSHNNLPFQSAGFSVMCGGGTNDTFGIDTRTFTGVGIVRTEENLFDVLHCAKEFS